MEPSHTHTHTYTHTLSLTIPRKKVVYSGLKGSLFENHESSCRAVIQTQLGMEICTLLSHDLEFETVGTYFWTFFSFQQWFITYTL